MRGHGQGQRGADVLPVTVQPRVGLHSLAVAVAVAVAGAGAAVAGAAAAAAAAACRLVVGYDLYVR